MHNSRVNQKFKFEISSVYTELATILIRLGHYHRLDLRHLHRLDFRHLHRRDLRHRLRQRILIIDNLSIIDYCLIIVIGY